MSQIHHMNVRGVITVVLQEKTIFNWLMESVLTLMVCNESLNFLNKNDYWNQWCMMKVTGKRKHLRCSFSQSTVNFLWELMVLTDKWAENKVCSTLCMPSSGCLDCSSPLYCTVLYWRTETLKMLPCVVLPIVHYEYYYYQTYSSWVWFTFYTLQ